MSTPIFFTKKFDGGLALLAGEEAHHAHSVLRKKPGDEAWVVDGEGGFFTGEILSVEKKSAQIRVLSEQRDFKKRAAPLEIAIAPTKSIDRLEWFLEKAVEIGIEAIHPILTKNTERTAIRHDRLEKILIAAMKQSVSAYLPTLSQAVDFQSFVKKELPAQRFICHCNTDGLPPLKDLLRPGLPTLICIGPEGDFTLKEVELAEKSGFTSVSLGTTRLRVETAGLVACCAFSWANS